jgi:cytochrome c
MRRFWVCILILGHAPVASYAAAIHDATTKDDVAGITAALESGADVNESDGVVTPLYIAAIRGKPDTTRLLIEQGADVNLPSRNGSPLHGAAQTGCLECVKLLVEAGADVNAITPAREPAVHLARKFGHSEVADYLMQNGYKIPVPPSIPEFLKNADPVKGEALYWKQCERCHTATPDLRIDFGPPLWGIVGKPKATFPNYKYSQPLIEAGGLWTFEELNAFISDPRRVLPGTLMESEGYQDMKDRADLIVYLRTLSQTPEPLP